MFQFSEGKDCGSCNYTSPYSGVLSSPDYPQSYGNRNCFYSITAAENHIIRLSFLDFSLKECCDFITVSILDFFKHMGFQFIFKFIFSQIKYADVPPDYEVSFTGGILPIVNNISSISNEMTIHFQSDGHGDNLISPEVFGWKAFLSVVRLT